MQVELDGSPVFLDTGGRDPFPALPALIFIHGAQHDHFVWKALVSRFASPSRNLLAPDLPGHGRSGGPPLPSIETMAGYLLALLAQCEKVGADGTASAAHLTLVGHSMGSLVAIEAAARLRGRVKHLVLIGTSLPMPVAPALLDAARNDEPRAMALINRWSHSPVAWRGGQRGAHGLWLPAINQRIMARQPRGTLFSDLFACNAYGNGKATAASIECPVTIIAGTADRMTSPKAARRMVGLFRHARLVELDAVGHALMAEAPAALGDALAAVL